MLLLGEPLLAFLDHDELAAIALLRDRFGIDPTRTYQFWEAAVARITSGTVTVAGCPWDVELPYGDETILIEVKFSQEFACRFRTGVRRVLKFAAPAGTSKTRAKPVHVTVLIGIDDTETIHTWAIPSGLLPRATSITLTTPRDRIGRQHGRSGLDRWYCPPTQLLPAVLDAFHA